MIAFLILTLLYFVYLHGILPQVPFDPSQVVLLWCLKWVLLFFIGLTFARAFCRYYRLRRLPAVLLAVLAVVFVLATLFTAAQMLQYTLDFLPTWLTGRPDTLTVPAALCAGASLSLLWRGLTSPKYVSKHSSKH